MSYMDSSDYGIGFVVWQLITLAMAHFYGIE